MLNSRITELYKENKNIMRRFGIGIFSTITILSIFAFTSKHSSILKPIHTAESKVNWMTIEEAMEQSKSAPRKIFIDVYTDWCGWCKRMDAATFQQAHIAKYLNENYYSVKFNAESKQDITYKGKKFSFVTSGRRGYHQLAAELTQGRLSYPTVVFLDESLNIIQPIPGYQEPKVFEQIITYFGGDNHKRQPWASYQRNYQSRLLTPKNTEAIETLPVKN